MISKYIDKLREGESLQADEAEQCLSAIRAFRFWDI